MVYASIHLGQKYLEMWPMVNLIDLDLIFLARRTASRKCLELICGNPCPYRQTLFSKVIGHLTMTLWDKPF